jgi:hypothetical protein
MKGKITNEKLKKIKFNKASSDSTVEEDSLHHPKVKGFNPATTGNER